MNVADCLANTGGPASSTLVMIGIAVVLIGCGLIAMRSKKRTGTMLGALAIVGALALVPLSSPSTAFAAAGDCVPATSQPAPAPSPAPAPAPAPTPDVTYVAPEAPTTAPMCGAAPVITTPESEYFTYEIVQEGTTATVTAELVVGLTDTAIEPGVVTTWTFDLSFTPATVLTAETLAFTYDGMSPNPRINDPSVAAFLEAQGAPLSFRTVGEFTYTYGVFTDGGERLLEWGETTQPTQYVTNFSATQAGQDVETTYVDSSYVNGFENARAYFAAQGQLPEGTYIGAFDSTEFLHTAYLTTTYVNECDVTETVTAATPYEAIPVQ